MSARRPWMVLALAWAACDLGDPLAAGDAAPLEVTMEARLLPGEEATWCRYVLPARDTPDGLAVERISHASEGVAAHHVIWYQMAETPESVAGRLAPFRCDIGVHLRKTGVLYAPPGASGELRWPEGVAAHLEPDAVTLVEWHVINFHPRPLDAAIHLRLTPPSAAPRLRAGTLLYYDWFVHVPPRATHTSQTRCRVPEDVTLMWASQHMHQRGVAFSARLLDAQGEPLRDLLATDRWDADPVWYDVGVPLARGQWIEFSCRYDNPSGYAVIEGDRADDEMCMFVGGYFPRIERPFGETCAIGAGSGPVFAGSATCAESVACLRGAADRVAAHACWNATRDEDTGALVAVAWRCASARCDAVCGRAGLSEACLGCLQAECGAELAACAGGA